MSLWKGWAGRVQASKRLSESQKAVYRANHSSNHLFSKMTNCQNFWNFMSYRFAYAKSDEIPDICYYYWDYRWLNFRCQYDRWLMFHWVFFRMGRNLDSTLYSHGSFLGQRWLSPVNAIYSPTILTDLVVPHYKTLHYYTLQNFTKLKCWYERPWLIILQSHVKQDKGRFWLKIHT